ncbi:hypothetical protein BWI96_16680 [Siphonobacter sp. SORGH_AS_0500]|uniref:hypothetical protein n=1 Tax=Siphonobacter sp. SORGH_AS_0500 TaxID=1864824 RepID=UPI000CC3EB84|nr:hypothetical protein [Siphonobacter sp. SORGH_AS_0500]PKK35534.1 hypothetical protein BWI96_16680 [Siphonobacter sp. SORGH_AS_0500]
MSLNALPPAYVTHTPVLLSDNPIPYQSEVLSAFEGAVYRLAIYVTTPDDTTKAHKQKIVTLRSDPVAGVMTYNLDEVVRNLRQFDIQIPAYNFNVYQKSEGHILWILPYQEADVDEEQSISFALGPLMVIKGGSSDFTKNDLADRFNGAFLSNFYDLGPKPVHYKQHDFLYWADNLDERPGRVRLRIKYFFTDGTDLTEDLYDIQESEAYAVYCFPIGPANMNIYGRFGNVDRYEVCLVNDQDKRLTEVREYIVDDFEYDSFEVVFFRNALGCYESLYFFGDDDRSETYQVEKAARPINYKGRQGLDLRVESRRKFTFRTGHYPEGWSYAFRELLHSTDIYVIDKNEYLPIQIDTEEINLRSRSNRLDTAELKFIESQTKIHP